MSIYQKIDELARIGQNLNKDQDALIAQKGILESKIKDASTEKSTLQKQFKQRLMRVHLLTLLLAGISFVLNKFDIIPAQTSNSIAWILGAVWVTFFFPPLTSRRLYKQSKVVDAKIKSLSGEILEIDTLIVEQRNDLLVLSDQARAVLFLFPPLLKENLEKVNLDKVPDDERPDIEQYLQDLAALENKDKSDQSAKDLIKSICKNMNMN